MMSAAAADDLGRGTEAFHDAVDVAVAAVVLLVDAREDEDLVVHRQAEQDGEHHHRHERGYGHGLVETDQRSPPPPLEHGDDHAVGRSDRQQVQQSPP
jgi:hypothetical protein